MGRVMKYHIRCVLLLMTAMLSSFFVVAQTQDGSAEYPYLVGYYDGVKVDYYQWAESSYGTAGTETHFKLTHDVWISLAANSESGRYQTMNINAGTVVLDLNGYELRLIAPTDGSANPVMFNVTGGARFILKSSGENGASGRLVGCGGAAMSEPAVVVNASSFLLESGSIDNFLQPNTANDWGGAVYVANGSVFEMQGGSIRNSGFMNNGGYLTQGGGVYVQAGAVMRFSGGTISGCSAREGGGVFLEGPTTNIYEADDAQAGLTMSGSALISGCSAAYRGGGVYVGATADYRNKFNMYGGSISECTAVSNGGCGVFSSGIVNMTGGTITRNRPGVEYYTINGDLYAPDYNNAKVMDSGYPYGGGICLQGLSGSSQPSVFTMNGGSIDGNVASSGGGIMAYTNSRLYILGDSKVMNNHAIGSGGTGNGGGIYVQSSDFNISSGIISGNSARRYGGGVNVNAYPDDNASLTLSGTCAILNNTGGHGGGISQEAGNCTLNINSESVRITGNMARGIAATIAETFKNDTTSMVDSTAYNCYLEGGHGGGIFVEKGDINISAGVIESNKAGGSGGGISIRGVRVAGNINLNMTGGSISNNISNCFGNYPNYTKFEGETFQPQPAAGGGIDIYARSTTKNAITVESTIASGVILGNKSSNGAGVSIFTDDNSSAVLELGRTVGSASLNIVGNMATQNGGGVYLAKGDIKMYGGHIENNSSQNGGGICLENGSIEIAGSNSNIQNNIAEQFGGGVYVWNDVVGGTPKSVTFSGGVITGNRAYNGGGISVYGNIDIHATDVIVRSNVANNGGGIYMLNDGKGSTSMVYNGGLVTNNSASGILKSTIETAYDNDANNLGVGGGVYLAKGTSLEFQVEEGSPLGLYGNIANTAADEVFANGVNTTLVLPNVNNMDLQDYHVVAGELYWVEDYVNGDTQYNMGTKVDGELSGDKVFRYRTAFLDMNFSAIHKIKLEENEHTRTYTDTYVCLAIGYDLFVVNLIKKGLKLGESALFDISYKKNGVWSSYGTISLPCLSSEEVGDAGVTGKLVLPAGVWKFEENQNWSGWKYDLQSIIDSEGASVDMSEGVLVNSVRSEALKEIGGFKYIFTNVRKDITVKSDEAVKPNNLKE